MTSHWASVSLQHRSERKLGIAGVEHNRAVCIHTKEPGAPSSEGRLLGPKSRTIPTCPATVYRGSYLQNPEVGPKVLRAPLSPAHAPQHQPMAFLMKLQWPLHTHTPPSARTTYGAGNTWTRPPKVGVGFVPTFLSVAVTPCPLGTHLTDRGRG